MSNLPSPRPPVPPYASGRKRSVAGRVRHMAGGIPPVMGRQLGKGFVLAIWLYHALAMAMIWLEIALPLIVLGVALIGGLCQRAHVALIRNLAPLPGWMAPVGLVLSGLLFVAMALLPGQAGLIALVLSLLLPLSLTARSLQQGHKLAATLLPPEADFSPFAGLRKIAFLLLAMALMALSGWLGWLLVNLPMGGDLALMIDGMLGPQAGYLAFLGCIILLRLVLDEIALRLALPSLCKS